MDDNPLKGGFKKKRVFISYGHDELVVVADRMKSDLIARGHDVWFDSDRIKAGADWESYIEDGLAWVSEKPREGCFLLIMTPYSVRRPDGFCLNELSRAILLNLKIIPVMLVWCEPPLSICRLQWLSMEDCLPLDERMDRYQAKFNILAEAIEYDKLDFEGSNSDLLNILKPLSYDAEVRYNQDRFIGRSWVFSEIDRWLAEPMASRIFWLAGGPGTGKTSISAWLCAHRREVVAFHFCRLDNVQKIDPRRCVMSIAYQLSTQLPEYRERLKSLKFEDVNNLNSKTLFDQLIVQPLSANFKPPDRTILILIDALDEATVAGKNELADFLASEFERTPDWLRVIITSRPDPEVSGPLQAYTPFILDVNDKRNRGDITEFLVRELKIYNNGADLSSSVVDSIAEKSGGLFLYAEWILKELKYNRLSLDHLEDFPQGLGGIYLKYFSHQFPDRKEWESVICTPLETISASLEPIDMGMLSSIFHWNVYEERRFRRSLGSLFIVDTGGIRPFHHSVMEWLTNDKKEDPYFISQVEGHKILAEYGLAEYKKGGNALSSYTIMYLPIHLCMAKRWDDLGGLLKDLNFIRASGKRDKYHLMKIWTLIEERSHLRMADVYGHLIDDPEKEDNYDISFIAELMKDTFHVEEALKLLAYLATEYRSSGETAKLQKILGDQARLLTVKSDFDAAMALLMEQERICRETGNLGDLQSCLYHQADILKFKNYFDRSLALFKEQERICRQIGNMDGLQRSISGQSLIHRVRGEFGDCLALLKEQEKICRELGSINGLEESLGDQGVVMSMMGDLDGAMVLLKEQEKLCRKIGNKEHLRYSLGSQAVIIRWRGDLDGSMALLKDEERLCHEIGSRFSLAESLGDQAIILRLRGDLDGSLALLKQRESASNELGDKYGLEFSLRNEAIILRLMGDLDGSLALLKEGEGICREIGHKRDLAISLGYQGITLYAKGDIDGAMKMYDQAEMMFREMGYMYGLQECLWNKASALYARGKADEALALLREQAVICRRMGLKPDLIKCLEIQGTILHGLENHKN
jgi:tetratricopeptide (TPR) repeat protein